MTNDPIRKKDKSRSSEQASRPRFGLRDSDFFCHQALVVRVFLYAIPFRRRKPHSETKQMNANKRTLARCQSGSVQLSVMGALRFGRLATNASSLSDATTSPPVCRAMVSSSQIGRASCRERV